jgi:hypothetical protein
MENAVKNNERSRICSVSDKGAIDDGILLGKRKDLKKTLLKVPQKSSAEKKEEKKNKVGSPRKWFPNAEGKYQCPFCEKSYKTPASVSNHLWEYHQVEKSKEKYEKAKEEFKNIAMEKSETDPLAIPTTPDSLFPISVMKWLEIIPLELVEAFDPVKLKRLIIDKRKKEEEKKHVAKN